MTHTRGVASVQNHKLNTADASVAGRAQSFATLQQVDLELGTDRSQGKEI